MGKYNFDLPRDEKKSKGALTQAIAVIIFREVAAIPVDDARHFIESNLGKQDSYSSFEVGRLIRAYLKHSGQLSNQTRPSV